jgi:hypothetical protein
VLVWCLPVQQAPELLSVLSWHCTAGQRLQVATTHTTSALICSHTRAITAACLLGLVAERLCSLLPGPARNPDCAEFCLLCLTQWQCITCNMVARKACEWVLACCIWVGSSSRLERTMHASAILLLGGPAAM